MNKALTNPTFDYSLVDKDTKNKLIWFEGELTRSRKQVADELIEHGKILHGVHELLADHSGGTFRLWLRSVGISPGSAQRAIDVYIGFNQLSNLDNLEVSALYILSTHEKAKKKALKYSSRGVKITHAMAKQIIEETNGGASKAARQAVRNNTQAGDTAARESGGGGGTEPETPTDPDIDTSGEDGRTDSDGTEPQENAPKPPRKGKEKRGGSPPKRLDRKAYYKMWTDTIGQPVRLVDKIGHGVSEHNGTEQQKVEDHLEAATTAMKEWMGVKG